jgi:hypothetical protein
MSLPPQTQRLKPLEEEECAERVQAWAEVPEKLRAHFDGERNFAESLGEDEPVVPLSGASETREFARFGPVKFALIIRMSVCA